MAAPAIRVPAQRAVLGVLSRSNEVGQPTLFLPAPDAGSGLQGYQSRQLKPCKCCERGKLQQQQISLRGSASSRAQARSTAQVLDAAQEDRRSTDARALLESVEASLRQQPSGPTKVRFSVILCADAVGPSARLFVRCHTVAFCPNPGAGGSQTRVWRCVRPARHAAPCIWKCHVSTKTHRRAARLHEPRQCGPEGR